MNLDKETGISIMKINDKLDSGDVSKVFKLKILENENAQSLSERLSTLASEKILNIIDDILDGNAIFKKQDDQNATYANKIDKSEGKINWNEEVEKIIGKINGLYPSPGAWFSFNGERHKILKAIPQGSNGNPGYVLNESLEVACGKNSLKILEIQREGKKAQKINEFIQGTKIKKGSNLNNA